MNARPDDVDETTGEITTETSSLPATATVDTSLAVALSRAELDQQIATAKAFPRSYQRVIDHTKDLVTLNEAVAEACNYALPRKGKNGRQTYINGPSVRFAEILAGRYGNCVSASRIVGEDGDYVVAEGIFQDLETLSVTRTQVRRRIVDSRGRRYSVDMVGVTGNAAAQIAKRNAILQGVGRALWDPMYQAALKAAAGSEKTMEARRAEMVKWLSERGVSEAELFAAVDVEGLADIGAEQIATLKSLIRQIKEGEITVDQAFRPEPPKAEGAARKIAEELAAQPPTEPPPPARAKGEPLPGFDERKAVKLVRAAKTATELEGTASGILIMLNGAELPVALDAALKEMRAHFAEKTDGG